MPLLRLSAFFLWSLFGMGYLALSPVVGMPLYSQLLFHPYLYPNGYYQVEKVLNIPRKEVFFNTADGLKLNGWYFKAPDSERTIIVSHGNGGNLTHRLWLAKALLQTRSSVFLYDYRGYGRSEGSPSLPGIVADGLAAYTYVTGTEKVPADRVVLYGESLGSGVTCELIKRNLPAKAVILQSGFYSLEDISRHIMHLFYLYPSFLFPSPALDNAQTLKGTHPPLLVMHGLKDTFLPPSQSQRLFAAASEKKQHAWLPRAGHNDVPDDPNFLPAVTGFFSAL